MVDAGWDVQRREVPMPPSLGEAVRIDPSLHRSLRSVRPATQHQVADAGHLHTESIERSKGRWEFWGEKGGTKRTGFYGPGGARWRTTRPYSVRLGGTEWSAELGYRSPVLAELLISGQNDRLRCRRHLRPRKTKTPSDPRKPSRPQPSAKMRKAGPSERQGSFVYSRAGETVQH
ncbi:hypothetical protein BD309DRAFT_598800 [Dichomitus squalens]|nr:hypothetical protein BD309DRAFT_598800 [Dichomitus squalens]